MVGCGYNNSCCLRFNWSEYWLCVVLLYWKLLGRLCWKRAYFLIRITVDLRGWSLWSEVEIEKKLRVYTQVDLIRVFTSKIRNVFEKNSTRVFKSSIYLGWRDVKIDCCCLFLSRTNWWEEILFWVQFLTGQLLFLFSLKSHFNRFDITLY